MKTQSFPNTKTGHIFTSRIGKDSSVQESPVFDLLPVGICVCDTKGVIMKYNPKATALWGQNPQPGDTIERFFDSMILLDPDGRTMPYPARPVASSLAHRFQDNEVEVTIERPDLTRVQVIVSATPIPDFQDSVAGALFCFQDITRQHNSHKETLKVNHELQDCLQNAAIGIHWVDRNGIINWANQSELDLLGYEAEEYIGHSILEFHVNQAKINDILTRLTNDETLNLYESELRCKDGSIKAVNISSNVYREQGNFMHTRCFTIDITQKKLLYSLIKDSEHRYRQLIQGLPAAVYTCDTNGYITLFNDAAISLWGREPVVGKDLWCGSLNIFTVNGAPLPLEACPMAIALREKRKVFGHEIVIERPDGTRRHVLPYPQPMFDTSGCMTGAINMLVDISNLREAEHALRESEERFSIAANTAPVLIWMCDTEKRRYFFNKCWLDFTGRTVEQETDFGWMESVHPDDKDRILNSFNECFEQQTEFKTEYRLRRKNGQYRWVHSHGIPRYTLANLFEGYIGTSIDINERKLYQEELSKRVYERTNELRIANEKLAISNKELEQFAYIASHDLQEPLRKVKSFGDLLIHRYGDKLDNDGVNFIQRMQSATERMKDLIDEILKFSRVATPTTKTWLDMPRELTGILNDLDALIVETGATIEIDPLFSIFGNKSQIRQVFQNLLGNALKFNIPGIRPEIRITSRLVQGKDTGFALSEFEEDLDFQLIEIHDNGIGFEQPYAEKIFKVFVRLHGSTKYTGSGIGLSIVLKIVENHNGHIRAIGRPMQGATFQLLFPTIES